MADDFDTKMDQFKEFLNSDKMAENLKALMSMLENQNTNTSNHTTHQTHENKESRYTKEQGSENNANPNMGFDLNTMETMFKIKKVYDRLNDTNDRDVNLLMALKPYLNSKRQSKIESAIKLVGLSKLPAIMREMEDQQTNVQNEKEIQNL